MSQDERNYYADYDDEPEDPRRSHRRLPNPPASGVSIASLVCGICFCVPMVTSVLAVIFGFVGIRKTRDPYVGGRGLSIAGLVLGVVGIGIWLVVGSLVFLFWTTYTTELKEVRDVSHRFVQALYDGKIDDALALATPEIDRKELATASAAMKSNGPFNEILADPLLIPADNTFRWEIEGIAVFSRAQKHVSMRLVKQGTSYRVERFSCK